MEIKIFNHQKILEKETIEKRWTVKPNSKWIKCYASIVREIV